MSNNKWEAKYHEEAPDETGDHDSHWEITNGKMSMLTMDESDDDFKGVLEALNCSPCDFYVDTTDTFLLGHFEKENKELIDELETLKAENSKMRQAIEEVRQHCKAAGVPKFKEDWVLIEIDKIATEVLKTP